MRLRAWPVVAAVLWVVWAASVETPVAAAQAYRVGLLWYGRPLDTRLAVLEAFRDGLGEQGFVEGKNLSLEHRHAGNHLERLPVLAVELVRAKVAVIVANGPVAIRAARQASTSVPIVMLNGDPAMFSNLARPGGNVTGLAALAAELAGKQLEVLKEAAPGTSKVAVLRNPAQPVHADKVKEILRVARALSMEVQVVEARGSADFQGAFASIARERAQAVLVLADGTFATQSKQLTELAARNRLPAVYGSPGYVRAGGLIEFVPDQIEAYRGAARYVARILKGAHPGDLPIEQPTKFQLVVNLKTAKALGLSMPPSLLLRADEIVD